MANAKFGHRFPAVKYDRVFGAWVVDARGDSAQLWPKGALKRKNSSAAGYNVRFDDNSPQDWVDHLGHRRDFFTGDLVDAMRALRLTNLSSAGLSKSGNWHGMFSLARINLEGKKSTLVYIQDQGTFDCPKEFVVKTPVNDDETAGISTRFAKILFHTHGAFFSSYELNDLSALAERLAFYSSERPDKVNKVQLSSIAGKLVV